VKTTSIPNKLIRPGPVFFVCKSCSFNTLL
jgi:hypothetical protein